MMSVSGGPNTTVTLQFTDDLLPPQVWRTLQSGNTDGNGLLSVSDDTSAVTSRFHRTVLEWGYWNISEKGL